ncbi:MAG: family 20 glycosylhydrolase [Chitinophagaceae bacterium]
MKFAAERHIRIIPEVETPGHARAAIKSMDARYRKLLAQGNQEAAVEYLLRDTNDVSVYTSVQGWSDNVVNVALPSVYRFLEKVSDELIAMYKEAGAPLSTIHFGGDEVPPGVWEQSPAVADLMQKETSVQMVDDLWYYYFGKVNAMLKKKGLYLSGWEEIALRKTKLDGAAKFIPNPGFVNENFHAYVWNNVWGWGAEDLAYRLANAGYKVILAPVTNFYFDLAYQKQVNEPGLYWGGYTDIDKSFGFAPYDYYKSAKENLNGGPLDKAVFVGKDRLTEFGKQNIVGIQCLIWSEMIRGPEQLEYMLLPKLFGFAQRAWSAGNWETEKDSTKAEAMYKNDWDRFVYTVGLREIPRLQWYNGGYHYRVPTPGATVENGLLKVNTQIPGMEIRYTADGREPTARSMLYTVPFPVKNTVKLKVFSGTRSGLTTEINPE